MRVGALSRAKLLDVAKRGNISMQQLTIQNHFRLGEHLYRECCEFPYTCDDMMVMVVDVVSNWFIARRVCGLSFSRHHFCVRHCLWPGW